MPGSLTNYGEELALNLLFRNTGSQPIEVFLGLATQPVSESANLIDVIEENDSNYSRQKIVFGEPSQVGDKGTIVNIQDIAFSPWAENAKSPITHTFIATSRDGTSGFILAAFQLDMSKQPASGETLTVPAGNLIFSLS